MIRDNDATANNTTLRVNRANAKALGLLAAGNTATDATITLGSGVTWDFDPSDDITSNQWEWDQNYCPSWSKLKNRH